MLKSFGIIWSAILGSLAAFAAWSLAVPGWGIWGLAAALVLGVVAWKWPYGILRPYRRWNSLALTVANYARMGLTGVCFVVVAVAGRSGAGIPWRRPRDIDSGWVPKKTLDRGAYASQSEFAAPSIRSDAWVRPLLHWSRVSRNLWIVTITPLLMLLSAVQREPLGTRVSETTYTLY